MLKTYFDTAILKEIEKISPSNFFNNIKESLDYSEYLTFLKSGTDLVITNFNESNPSILYDSLTRGRGNTTIQVEKSMPVFHKNSVSPKYGYQDIFFLDEENLITQKQLRTLNHHYFGFLNDHFASFQKLSINFKGKTIPVRKNRELNRFTSWSILRKYLLPFSDCIIIDNYLFSQNRCNQNLLQILLELDKVAPKNYNLLILTFRGVKKIIHASECLNLILKYKKDYSLKFDPTIIVLKNTIEHDRNILMNYLRIKSGHSLNYFNTYNRVMVDTELSILPFTTEENFVNAEVILKDISPKIKRIISENSPDVIQGNGNYNLFT